MNIYIIIFIIITLIIVSITIKITYDYSKKSTQSISATNDNKIIESTPAPKPINFVGNKEGKYTELICPHEKYVKLFYGKAGGLIDNMGIICSNEQNLGVKGSEGGGDPYRISSNTGFDKLSIKWGDSSISGEYPLGTISMHDGDIEYGKIGRSGTKVTDLVCKNDKIGGLKLYGNNFVTGLEVVCKKDVSPLVTPPPFGDCPANFLWSKTTAGKIAQHNCSDFDSKYTGGVATRECDVVGSSDSVNFSLGKWLEPNFSKCETSCLADYAWPNTKSGEIASINCKDAALGPNFIGGNATRECGVNGIWSPANYSTCETKIAIISGNDISGKWRYQVGTFQYGDVDIVFDNNTKTGVINGIVSNEVDFARRWGYDKIKYQEGSGYIIAGNAPVNFINDQKNFLTNSSIYLRKIETKNSQEYIGGTPSNIAPSNGGDDENYRAYVLELLKPKIIITPAATPSIVNFCLSNNCPSVRYITLKRIDNKDEYINIMEIEIYDTNGNKITSDINASLSPSINSGPLFEAPNVINGKTTGAWQDIGMGHTGADKNAYIQLDLGSDKIISKIIIYNRSDYIDWQNRIIGTSLILKNSAEVEIKSIPITESKDKYEFVLN